MPDHDQFFDVLLEMQEPLTRQVSRFRGPCALFAVRGAMVRGPIVRKEPGTCAAATDENWRVMGGGGIAAAMAGSVPDLSVFGVSSLRPAANDKRLAADSLTHPFARPLNLSEDDAAFSKGLARARPDAKDVP